MFGESAICRRQCYRSSKFLFVELSTDPVNKATVLTMMKLVEALVEPRPMEKPVSIKESDFFTSKAEHICTNSLQDSWKRRSSPKRCKCCHYNAQRKNNQQLRIITERQHLIHKTWGKGNKLGSEAQSNIHFCIAFQRPSGSAEVYIYTPISDAPSNQRP